MQIEFSRLVADLLNHHLQGERCLERYSDLSAIAHGLRLGANSFVPRNDKGAIKGLIAAQDLVVNWATKIVVSMPRRWTRSLRPSARTGGTWDVYGPVDIVLSRRSSPSLMTRLQPSVTRYNDAPIRHSPCRTARFLR
jgi:hypothetical protein